MAASRRELLRLLDQLEGKIARGFYEAVKSIKDRARLNALIAAIQANDIDAAMSAIGFRPGAWSMLTETIRNAYVEAGIFTILADVPKRFGMTFDINNPRAEEWLRRHSSSLIVQINEGQRNAIRLLLEAGVAAGRNPRNIGLDIIGRISPQTGRRAGGVIGLWGPEPWRKPGSTPVEWVIKAREELEDLDDNYFNRTRRDKRFDSKIRKAIESGTPLKQEDINRIVGRYEDRLLELRGSTIGRTEALQSLNEASDEALRQVVGEGLAQSDAVKRIWDSAGDSRTRESHVAMDGQERGLDEAFETGAGHQLMHPGDFTLGAPGSEIINCRCIVTHEIDFIAVELAA